MPLLVPFIFVVTQSLLGSWLHCDFFFYCDVSVYFNLSQTYMLNLYILFLLYEASILNEHVIDIKA